VAGISDDCIVWVIRKLSTGVTRHIEQRNEWLFVHIVAVYWV